MNQLAIVIPAYKINYFEQVLISLTNQTSKDFNLYIGIDATKADFESIINRYKKKLNIVYKRFNNNLGGTDLVAQWTRCIALTNGEPWIWLFSDDDMIGERCVELFLNNVSNDFDLYHFNVKRINSKNNIICEKKHFPKLWSGKDMFLAKQYGKIDSFVIEYIFSRKIYEKTGGFQNFPMAWGSDIATWIKFASDKGIRTISGDFIYWRKSDENITPSKNRDIAIRKIKSEIDYYDWVNKYFNSTLTKQCAYLFVRSLTFYSPFLLRKDAYNIIFYACDRKIIGKLLAKCLTVSYPLILYCKRLKLKFQNQNKH